MSQPKRKIIRKKKIVEKPFPEPAPEDPDTALGTGAGDDMQPAEEVAKDPEPEEDLSMYKLVRPLLVPTKDIPYLAEEQRLELRKNHPNLAEYIFMTPRERSKYFHQKNLGYNKVMELPGNLPARKIFFKRTFQVRVFAKQEAPDSVKTVKSFRDKYNQKIHYG